MGDKVIGIFLSGQKGDILSASSVLHYRNELWGDSKIIWYADKDNFDLLKYQDIELREFPRGFGYPEMTESENKKLISEGKEPKWEDWQPLVDCDNHLNLALKHKYPSLVDITQGFFPAPHQMSVKKRANVPYPNISKKVFGIPDNYEWHPVLKFSNEERESVKQFIDNLPEGRNICLETMAGSGQSLMSDTQIRRTMQICKDVLGKCNFIFVSHKYLKDSETFPEDYLNNENIFFAKNFSVRQCALLISGSGLLISVSSGISVTASAWGLNDTPILQFCGSEICSTRELSLGKFELVTHSDRPLQDAVQEYEEKLISMLNFIK